MLTVAASSLRRIALKDFSKAREVPGRRTVQPTAKGRSTKRAASPHTTTTCSARSPVPGCVCGHILTAWTALDVLQIF